MKRLCIQALVLCAMLTALTATAFADDGMVKQLNIQDANVAVAPLTDAGETIAVKNGTYQGARKFQITLSGAQDGALYLAMIRTGDGVPTKDNLYWCDVVAGSGGAATLQANSSKPMSDGSYDVWITDDTNDRNVKQIGSFDYMTFKLGYVCDGDEITAIDALWALRMSVGLKNNGQNWTPKQIAAANIDKTGDVSAVDALWILERSVGLRDNTWTRVPTK